MKLDSLRLESDSRLATVTLARPAAGNAVDARMASELREVCGWLDQDEASWVVVIIGDGDFFCGGTESGPLAGIADLRVADAVASIQKPVIAALNGDALDQGLEIALACDIRIASSRARMGLTQVEQGRIPWDGGTQRLPRLVGRGRAMELVLTGRVVDAPEALDMGLVNRVAEPSSVLQEARELAAAVAQHGPIAARYLKEAVSKGEDMTLDHGLRLEADLSFILQSTDDRAEGIKSFLERRKPGYRGE